MSSASGTSLTDAVRLTSNSAIRGLRRRFVFAIAALVAVVLAAQGAVLTLFGYQHFRAELEARARAYAELAAGPAGDAYRTYFASGFSKFRQLILDLAALNGDLDRLALYDVEGQLLFSSDRLDPAAPAVSGAPAGERLGAALRGLEVVAWREDVPGVGVRYVVVAPDVEEWGRHRYSAVFLFGYDSLWQAMGGAVWTGATLALLALALGVGCAYLLSAQSLVPLEQLTRGARLLAEGNLEHRIDLRTGDEFETLGATFDQMAGRLASTIEDLERSNQRLARLNDELKQLDRVKSDLLANVSHELRTPLTAISGYVEALTHGLLGPLDPDQCQALLVMERNILRLRGMIDQLLSYSRMESGRLAVELAPFDLEAVARHVVEAVRAAQGTSYELRFHCPAELPEVYGDGARISQVIENLLTNAVKFSPGGEPIDLTIREVGDGVEVEVRDRGIGIPPELQAKIFERFYQVDASARRHYGGIGLGLAIVREILELNHSRIEVESRPGEGATFRFVLPVAADRTGTLPLQGRTRIAIVDDDAGFVQRVAAHLSAGGFAVDTAATAEQGYSLIRRVRPHAVLLDRLLPDGDGFDLLKKLKQHPRLRDIPVILATVRRERALGMRLGAAAYLRKPLEPAALEKLLRQLLDSDRPSAVAP